MAITPNSDGKSGLLVPTPIGPQLSIMIGDVEVYGTIECTPSLENKLDIQTGSGANKGSVSFQGRELGKVSLKITIGIEFYAKKMSFMYQEQQVLKAAALLFPASKDFKGVPIIYPSLAQFGMRDFACSKMTHESDVDSQTKTFTFELVEFYPRKKPKVATVAVTKSENDFLYPSTQEALKNVVESP